MSCTCDETSWPVYPDIAPGLTLLPRQWLPFPDVRRAMLDALGDPANAPALTNWRARDENDLGVMLIEMAAYLADSLSFYDQVHAHECYLRTARRRPSVRKLVDHLAYVPAPAVGATAELALFADGRQAVTVPAGTAFRSGGFDDEAPQVFELEKAVTIHPLANKWAVATPASTSVVAAAATTLLLDPATAPVWQVGDLAFLRPDAADDTTWRVRAVTTVATVEDADGAQYLKLDFDGAVSDVEVPLAGFRISRPTQTAGVWTYSVSTTLGIPLSSDNYKLYLDGVYRQLKTGQHILVELRADANSGRAWFTLSSVTDATISTVAGIGENEDGDVINYTGNFFVSKLTLDALIIEESRGANGYFDTMIADGGVTIHHSLIDGGTLTAMPSTSLAATDPLALSGKVEVPSVDPVPTAFLLVDVNDQAVRFSGSMSFSAATITPDGGSTGGEALTLPVTAYGNVATVSRGQTVSGEVLGSGDASLANLSFSLKKSPLTYLASATTSTGVASTLTVKVDGKSWTEVASFYGQAADAEIYVVRADDDGVSSVTFGDGVNGARAPTGTNNVVATYRFGAGVAAPPAGSISQITRPPKGLRSVKQPIAAAGGSDAESAENIRTCAPRQALTLGRAVSIQDMHAFVAAMPGVSAATVTWQWDGSRQGAVVAAWYIGAASLRTAILARLQGVSDPTTPFVVNVATPVAITLALEVDVDVAYDSATVHQSVADALWDPDQGVLAPGRIGIGVPFFFSKLRAQAQSVTGVLAVRAVWTNTTTGAVASGYATSPGAGKWFDIGSGALTIHGQEYPDGN